MLQPLLVFIISRTFQYLATSTKLKPQDAMRTISMGCFKDYFWNPNPSSVNYLDNFKKIFNRPSFDIMN